MTRRPAAAPAVEEDLDCLLCGTTCEPFWHPVLEQTVVYELCPRCCQAFQETADRVAEAYRLHDYRDAHCGHPAATGVAPVPGVRCHRCRPAEAAPAVVQVAGQLELPEKADCNCAAEFLGTPGWHDPSCDTERQAVPARGGRVLTALELDDVVLAASTGDWSGVSTTAVADAVAFHADELIPADLRACLVYLGRMV